MAGTVSNASLPVSTFRTQFLLERAVGVSSIKMFLAVGLLDYKSKKAEYSVS